MRFAGVAVALMAIGGLRYFELGPLALIHWDFWEAVLFGAPQGWEPAYDGWWATAGSVSS